MVDFTTVSLGILLVTSIFNSIDAVLKRVKKSKCRGVEVEFGKEAAPPAQTVTNTTITNNTNIITVSSEESSSSEEEAINWNSSPQSS